jgi:hypothetical protein
MGMIAGRSSPAKAVSSRENGRKGGRPRTVKVAALEKDIRWEKKHNGMDEIIKLIADNQRVAPAKKRAGEPSAVMPLPAIPRFPQELTSSLFSFGYRVR